MTVKPETAALMGAVFPKDEEAPTYAILDGARDELIHPETVVSKNPRVRFSVSVSGKKSALPGNRNVRRIESLSGFVGGNRLTMSEST